VKSRGPLQIELLPLGTLLQADPGSSLHDLLFPHGVEFPCGGHGRCKGCRVRVLQGSLPPSQEDLLRLAPAELEQGWRLACRARLETNLQLELAQWDVPILADDSTFPFAPQPGLGIAVDLGSTTLVAQLVDLGTSHVLAVRTALNAQAQYGADLMSRIEFGRPPGQRDILTRLVRHQIGELVTELLFSSDNLTAPLEHVVIVGNTVMHHLFGGLDVEPLAQSPFEPASLELLQFSPESLGWELSGQPTVRFLPALGGFVGSDLLAGILATRLHQSEPLVALIDLGTNGEIILGNRQRILCASTAAGPAFEGARISSGMRAASGAIDAVHVLDRHLQCHVLGGAEPRGICGSGLVDAVAAALELGLVAPNGRLLHGDNLSLHPPVILTQLDIRELQLAKGAIAAGLELLLDRWGAQPYDLACIHLAGAFGNYINRSSARRVGLLKLPPDHVRPAGNTALLGAKMALFDLHSSDGSYPAIRRLVEHVPLNEHPRFQDIFVRELPFPQ
jgi:uncharacterized 2Fe-2S/4Fe-4S cluster protein (DUF4445 family)